VAVVVTGGTGVLGSAVVQAFVDRGATVHVPEFAGAVPDGWSLNGHGSVVVTTGVDLTDPKAVQAFYAPIDALEASVHCAGGFVWANIADAELTRMWSMNAHTSFLCSQAAVARFRARGEGGRIVNVASRQALMPRMGSGTVPYTMSKAAVAALTMALAEELLSEGILVNAVAPAILDTPVNRASMPNANHAEWTSVEAVAKVMVWLASSDNPVASGSVLPVFGAAR
jgi:NAD(P)-dependent dehydrogenase (short-subunit alcohol dehydrogenase family)